MSGARLGTLVRGTATRTGHASIICASTALRTLGATVAGTRTIMTGRSTAGTRIRTRMATLRATLSNLETMSGAGLGSLVTGTGTRTTGASICRDGDLAILGATVALTRGMTTSPGTARSRITTTRGSLAATLGKLMRGRIMSGDGLRDGVMRTGACMDRASICARDSLTALRDTVGHTRGIVSGSSTSRGLMSRRIAGLARTVRRLTGGGSKGLSVGGLASNICSICNAVIGMSGGACSVSGRTVGRAVGLAIGGNGCCVALGFGNLAMKRGLKFLDRLGCFAANCADSGGCKAPRKGLTSIAMSDCRGGTSKALMSSSCKAGCPSIIAFRLVPRTLGSKCIPLRMFIPVVSTVDSNANARPMFLGLS